MLQMLMGCQQGDSRGAAGLSQPGRRLSMENGCGEGDSPPGSCLPGGAAQNPECAWRRQAERLGEVGVTALPSLLVVTVHVPGRAAACS